MATKVTIELTEAQARIVLVAVEEWFRLRMGQWTDLANGLAFLGFHHSTAKPGDFDKRIERRDSLESVARAMLEIAFPRNKRGNLFNIEPEVHVASDIWSQLRWELSAKQDWMSTPHQMGSEPMIKVTVED